MNNVDWNIEQWERFEFVDIMHDMTDVNENKLLNKCLKELGYDKYQNVTPTSSKKKYEDTDSIEFGTTESPNVNFSRNIFTRDELYKMRNLLDFAVIKHFFIDAAHKVGMPSYSGEAILDEEETKKYSSYFDYSIINNQKLAEVSHKATTANVCDPATTSVFMDQIIDKDGSQIIYSNTETPEDNKIYYGFPYGSIVKTKIINEDKAGLTKGCYVYVQYNTDTKNEVYKFSAFYRIDFEEDTSTSISREKFVKNPHVTYERVDPSAALKGIFNLKDDDSEKFQKTAECVTPVINLSNSEKAQYFEHEDHKDKDKDKDKPEDVKFIKQGIEYIVLKAYGDRNQSSFLKEINEDSETIYNSSNTCILSTDSHLIQAAAHTSDKENYRIQCVYKHNTSNTIIVDSVINKDTGNSIVSYQTIIQKKCQPTNSLPEPKIKVVFAKNVENPDRADLLIKNDGILYAEIKIKQDHFQKISGNGDSWKQVKTYLINFFNILINKNNKLVKDVITKIRDSKYYNNIIDFKPPPDASDEEKETFLKLLQKFNDFIDALLSLIIEKQLSKYMKDKDNLFTLFPLIYNNVAKKNYFKESDIIKETDFYFNLISDNEKFQGIIEKSNTNSLYILTLLDNFIGGEDFLANFLENIDFIYDSIIPKYDWFNNFDVYPTGDSNINLYSDVLVAQDGGVGIDDPMLGAVQKGGGTTIDAVYKELCYGRDDLFFLKFLYLLNLDYSTIKNSTIISSILSYKILNDAATRAAAAARTMDVEYTQNYVPLKTGTKREVEVEVLDYNKPQSPKMQRLYGGSTKKRKKTNKKIQTLKKKLTKKIKKMKENFKNQVIKLNLRKYNRTPKKNKLITTIKRRKNKKDKKHKKDKKTKKTKKTKKNKK
jgi:hypothetical protein